MLYSWRRRVSNRHPPTIHMEGTSIPPICPQYLIINVYCVYYILYIYVYYVIIYLRVVWSILLLGVSVKNVSTRYYIYVCYVVYQVRSIYVPVYALCYTWNLSVRISSKKVHGWLFIMVRSETNFPTGNKMLTLIWYCGMRHACVTLTFLLNARVRAKLFYFQVLFVCEVSFEEYVSHVWV